MNEKSKEDTTMSEVKSKRCQLIEELRDIINKNESANLTTEQVSHWVGSDASESRIDAWITETHELGDPVTVDDVLSLWVESHLIKVEQLIPVISEMGNITVQQVKSLYDYETPVTGENLTLKVSNSTLELNGKVILLSDLSVVLVMDTEQVLISIETPEVKAQEQFGVKRMSCYSKTETYLISKK